MQRKPTKNTRGPNALEKEYQGWLKEQPCAYCGQEGPSIVDHAEGSCFKHLKTLIGHAFCTSKCQKCDDIKTFGSHKLHYGQTGITHSEAWAVQTRTWFLETEKLFSSEIHWAIEDWNR